MNRWKDRQMIERRLWDGTSVPALGFGCWAIGGAWTAGDLQAGWGDVDDAESIRAIHAGADLGIRLFDTAQTYGAGHSEAVLGQALAGRPDIRVATKVGYAIDPAARRLTGEDASPAAIAQSIDASLRRLRRDRIDLVHLHLNELPVEQAEPVFDALEVLRTSGKIGAYGWSTDFPDRAAVFADRPGFVSVQHAMNVFFRAEAMIPVIEATGLLSMNRSPLAMGLLSGKYVPGRKLAAEDLRSQTIGWMAWFKDGEAAPGYLDQLAAVQGLLQTGGRSLVQGALCWLWARSARSFPIPGFRTVAQVTELAGALAKGPLPTDVMTAIETLILREPEGPPRAR
jgi:aryl-alcohol dehydrogenase-like predicted oxidoreductase